MAPLLAGRKHGDAGGIQAAAQMHAYGVGTAQAIVDRTRVQIQELFRVGVVRSRPRRGHLPRQVAEPAAQTLKAVPGQGRAMSSTESSRYCARLLERQVISPIL